jgi:hypothetical protein
MMNVMILHLICSSFIIHYLSFTMPIHHSSFIIHHSPFIIYHSSFIINLKINLLGQRGKALGRIQQEKRLLPKLSQLYLLPPIQFR